MASLLPDLKVVDAHRPSSRQQSRAVDGCQGWVWSRIVEERSVAPPPRRPSATRATCVRAVRSRSAPEGRPNGGRLAVPWDNFYSIWPWPSRLSFGPGDRGRSSGAQPDSRRAWLVVKRHAHVARSEPPGCWPACRPCGFSRAVAAPTDNPPASLQRAGLLTDWRKYSGKPASEEWTEYATSRPPYWPVCPHETAHALGVARAPKGVCARLGTLYARSERSGGRRGRRGSGKGAWADGEGGDVARAAGGNYPPTTPGAI
jgi:hypothetical protein